MKSLASWEELRDERLAAMSPEECRECEQAVVEAEDRLNLAGRVYNARIAAGLSRAEFAQQAGVDTSVVEALEEATEVSTSAEGQVLGVLHQ